MAIMYPADIQNYNYTESEKEFYLAIKEQLADKYHVFYSVRWFEMSNDRRIDSEADFIVFDPGFGFLAIEVKGGVGIRIDSGNWFLIESQYNDMETERALKCSPYIQAEKSMRHFYNYFYQEYNQIFSGVYGYAVAFPRFAVNEIIANEAPMELTIDFGDINNLAQKINAIFHFWKNKRNNQIPFSQEQRKRFINSINKRISLSAAAGALIPIKEKEFAGIDFIQDCILDTLFNYHQVQIIGGAGTGKTFIGMKKAIRDAIEGERVLFICCSNELARYVNGFFNSKFKIKCCTFKELMLELLDNKFKYKIDNDNRNICYLDLLNDIDIKHKYDSIIVDEAQDFDLDMGLTIRSLLIDEKRSSLYVFYDKNQNVFSKKFENAFDIEYPPFVLRYNIRNTGSIYKYAVEMTGLGEDTVANNLMGINPEYIEFKNSNQTIKTLTNIVNRLVQKEYVATKSIVLLSDVPYEQSILKDQTSVGAYDVSFNDLTSISENEICFKTSEEFKGLEANVVIYFEHVYEDLPASDKMKCSKYVALTRARYYLYILTTKSKITIGD